MTGAESVAGAAAAAKALAAAAQEAVGEDDATKSALVSMAANSAEMENAAKVFANRVAVKQQILLKLYRPLAALLGISKSYFDTDFGPDLADRTAEIPDEDLVSPKASIALPAMMGLAFSLDEPDLKEMYLQLLATASDGRTPGAAHPSFAEIIKQLDSAEVVHLSRVLAQPTWPIATIRLNTEEPRSHQEIYRHVLEITVEADGTPDDLTGQVDNWIRLGLVDVDYLSWLTADGQYEFAEELVRQMADENSQPEGRSFGFQKGVLRVTSFGRRFARAVGIGE